MNPYTGVANLEAMEEAERYNAFLFNLVSALVRPGDAVLDFGAGSGTFAQRLRATGLAPLCVEPDTHLRSLLEKEGLPTAAGTAGIASESVDVVYSLNVLEHIVDDAAALAELRRVLRPGGTLLIYVPAFMLLYSSMDARVGHVRRYRSAGLARLVEASGFRIRYLRYADSLGFLAALALRFLGRRDGVLSPSMVRFYDRWLFPLSRAMDLVLGGILGKNLVLHAYRPQSR